METVRELLAGRGEVVYSVRPTATVFEALRLMAEKNIGAVMVAEAGKLYGIFSERDFARAVVGSRKVPETTSVKEIMTTRVVSINPETRIGECMALMTEKGIRHLPVLEGERIIGLISMRDVVKSVLSEKEMVISQQAYKIDQLETYMSLTP